MKSETLEKQRKREKRRNPNFEMRFGEFLGEKANPKALGEKRVQFLVVR